MLRRGRVDIGRGAVARGRCVHGRAELLRVTTLLELRLRVRRCEKLVKGG